MQKYVPYMNKPEKLLLDHNRRSKRNKDISIMTKATKVDTLYQQVTLHYNICVYIYNTYIIHI